MALTHDAYTIGWICALSVELAAAMVMLDEHHDPLPQPRTDTNTYELGRIGKHNVVLAGLPSGWTGTVSALHVATQLQSTFPEIRYGLMVGVGGGVPSDENDIRLGDITVSRPGLRNGGVVHYNFGKIVEGGRFIQTGALSLPPQKLLTAMKKVEANHHLRKFGYIKNLQDLPDDVKARFPRPSVDRQFVATYNHVRGAPTCDQCKKRYEKQLTPREAPVSRVFYGTITCADQVMRHGKTRDRIAAQSGAICFEMEAAGLINTFPCVAIRGICDYADTHKNKQWQPYAALAAAAYAKELLDAVAPLVLAQEAPMGFTVAQTPSSSSTLSDFTPTQPSAMGFFSMLSNQVLELDGIAVGRFVLDIHAPWDAYCPFVRADDDRIGVSLQFRFSDILQTSQADAGLLSERISAVLQMPNPLEALSNLSEKTYLLLNAEDWLKSACADVDTRKWLENSIKRKRPVFLVAGIHVVSKFPTTNDELIVAILYRRVSFGWFWRQSVDSATLVREPNIWEASIITKTADEDGSEDGEDEEESLVKVGLENSAHQEIPSNESVLRVNSWTFVL